MGAGIDFPRQDLFGTRNRDRRNLGSQFIAGPVDLLVDIGLARQDDALPLLLGTATRLVDDVSDFMGLRAGDLLLLGCAPGRPLARVGDQIDIHAPALPALGTLRNHLCHYAQAT